MKLSQTVQFKKDIKRLIKQGKDQRKLIEVVQLLLTEHLLLPKHRDHPLKGAWKDRRDCHIEPDWVLIYSKSEDELRLERTGGHSDLF